MNLTMRYCVIYSRYWECYETLAEGNAPWHAAISLFPDRGRRGTTSNAELADVRGHAGKRAFALIPARHSTVI